jgi:hypothetical protein
VDEKISEKREEKEGKEKGKSKEGEEKKKIAVLNLKPEWCKYRYNINTTIK